MADLYFRQLLAGRDFATSVPFAGQMQNFAYIIGDREAGEALLVDPAWGVRDLVDIATADGLTVTGALVTHYHPDHVGGDLFGMRIEGLPTLMEVAPCKVHVHRYEAAGVRLVTGLSDSDLVKHDSNDKVKIGGVEIELLHTPGHTPGSICFKLDQAIVAGDTLFLQGCGRVDLPGGDAEQMFQSLQKLKGLPDDTVLYPGHAYGGEHAPMSAVRARNYYLQVPDVERWKQVMKG